MDRPAAPKDTSLRNIIDKLAEFVARNGPEFESMTKSKQNGNPKFQFLYGGEFYNYYMFRVLSEQALLKQQQLIAPQMQTTIPSLLPGYPGTQVWKAQAINSSLNSSSTNTQPTSAVTAQVENINVQQNTLKDQICQSEQNLQAQHTALMQQQQTQIDDGIIVAQNELIQKLADEIGISVQEFDNILQPIIDSCTKDSISSGKSWILQHSSDSAKCNVISKYLLKKALINGAGFSQKLHLIYLINDVLHHCVRKNANELKTSLENVVIPMFCSAELIANDDQRAKLIKLLTLWESKANFFDACVMSKLRSAHSSMQEYKTSLLSTHSSVVNAITQATKQTFENYQQQHQAFIQHATQQIAILETQKQTIEQQTLSNLVAATSKIPPLITSNESVNQQQQISNGGSNSMFSSINSSQIHIQPQQQSNQIQSQKNSNNIPPLMSTNLFDMPTSQPNNNFQSVGDQQEIEALQMDNFNLNQYNQASESPNSCEDSNGEIMSGDGGEQIVGDFSYPPPIFQIPDLSKPPPGFVSEEDLTPTVPYFELPAGLMVPLIRLEDYNYKQLDPTLIKLPPPTLPNERLVTAVEAFYSLPSHDRPRDGEGWEKLGLYEYYKVKNAAKKQKEEDIENRIREKSRSPSPIIVEAVRPKSNKRRYRSKSRSKTRSKSRSRSKTPPLQEIRRNSGGSGGNRSNSNRMRQKSCSPINRKSPSPVQNQRRNLSPSVHRRERNRGGLNIGSTTNSSINSDKIHDRERSASPVSFFGNNFSKTTTEHIEESNKGHQMLMKMGWGGTGTGLGVQGQGIDSPIQGGEVRDRNDLYKGVGINLNDPYENFRKNKGAAFITRMKARAEERS